jgi:hypothetical protein
VVCAVLAEEGVHRAEEGDEPVRKEGG